MLQLWYCNLKEGYIYVRVGDKNTPISQNATIPQIEMLWKKRFGLTQPPLTTILSFALTLVEVESEFK